MEEFGDRLRRVRVSKGLTQCEAAILCNLPDINHKCQKEHFSQYERGKRYPNAKTLYILCVGLGVSADYLLGIKETEEQ